MKRDLTRKQFLGLGVGLAAFAIGCGGDDSGGDDAAGTGGGSGSGSGSTGSDPTTPDPSTTAPDPTTVGPDDTTTGPNPTTGGSDDTTGGSDDTAGSDDSTGGTADACGTSFDIHPHTLEIPADDVVAGTEKMYVAGGAHDHDVLVTAADFAELAANGTVQVPSGPSGMHSHVVTITCR